MLIRFFSVLVLGLTLTLNASSQELKDFKLYTPTANAEKDIAAAVSEAKASGKNVLVQIGGNWCIWCMRFNDFVTKDAQLDSMTKASYVVYHMNYSEENKNEKLLAKYKYPQRFGFPVFLVLNSKGELLHTQNTSYLESGKSYDKRNVMGFLRDWSAKALDPAQYKETK